MVLIRPLLKAFSTTWTSSLFNLVKNSLNNYLELSQSNLSSQFR